MLLKTVLQKLLNHCLHFRQKNLPAISQRDQSSEQQYSASSTDQRRRPSIATTTSSSSSGTSDDVVAWGPVVDDSTLQRRTRLDALLHSATGHKFVLRLGAMFGIDLVTHGFRQVFRRMVDGAVAKLALFVPDGLHLPLPPHFASDAHLNMVLVKDGDQDSGEQL